MNTNKEKLVVAISSRALFDLDECHQIYKNHGIDAYRQYQLENECNILEPGPAFHIAEKFLKLNSGKKENSLVEVILLSRNSADTGLRIFRSIEHYNLDITRAAFSGGQSPYVYAQAFGADLFLSLHAEDVKKAIQSGCAAAHIHYTPHQNKNFTELKIAFDGDAVLFSDESEQYYQSQGLSAFNRYEKDQAQQPMTPGPFRGFLSALHQLQQISDLPISIRTALVTARQAPAHERVVNTLRSWNIRIDESIFLGGLEKSAFLNAFNADIFFDDQFLNCQLVSQSITSGHVMYGIQNSFKEKEKPIIVNELPTDDMAAQIQKINKV